MQHQHGFKGWTLSALAHRASENPRHAPSRVSRDDDWGLTWEPATKTFEFLNRQSGASETVTVKDGPTALAARAALEVALRSGRENTVARLLEFNIDLSQPICDGATAIEWSISQRNLNLMEIFLARMAVKSRDRVAATRALSLAVRAQDTAAVSLFLSHGVRCDFENEDRPPPWNSHGISGGCTWGIDPSDPEDFMPPLVRAVLHNDKEVAKILLHHGADANVGYHDLYGARQLGSQCMHRPIEFSCGRVIQLAMELRLYEIVQLLIHYGADIGLAAPIWNEPGHKCHIVPRAVWQRVTAALRQLRSANLK